VVDSVVAAAQQGRKLVAILAVDDFAGAPDGGLLPQQLDGGQCGSYFEECDGTLEDWMNGVEAEVEVGLAPEACDDRATVFSRDSAQVAGDTAQPQVQDAPRKMPVGPHSSHCRSR
jgi:hypothetical protein